MSVLFNFDVDLKNKVLKCVNESKNQHSTKHITDIDMNKFVIANATNEADIQVFNLSDLKEPPIYITCGSKSIKSYLPHPTRPGVSLVKVTQSKVIAALGNIMRVYSFDVQ
jgi:hypothetical protein